MGKSNGKKNNKALYRRGKIKRCAGFVFQAVILVLVGLFIVWLAKQQTHENPGKDEEKEEAVKVFDLWYSYTGYEPYLKEAALRFEEKTGVKVRLTYYTNIEYLDRIYSASASGNGPDLFLMSEESLQNAVLLGIAEQNYEEALVNTDSFSQKAVNSITYMGKLYGYPMGFETSVMAINQDYVESLPSTFDDIKTYADSFNNLQTDEGIGAEDDSSSRADYSKVTNILKWDMSNVLYSYGFIGAYLNVGGEYRDNPMVIDVKNENAIAAGKYYYSLAEYFYSDIEESSYEQVIADFMDDKIVYTIASTDIIQKIKESGKNIALITIPTLNGKLFSRQVSVTDIIMINPFADMKEEAKEFAELLSLGMAEEMYDICGVISAKRIEYENDNINKFYAAYEKSTGFPKLMTTADYWIKITNVLKNIWNGSDVEEQLSGLFEDLDNRIN